MAVIQISKIQIRRGLQENLPQLASAEMGWSVDQRKLYIGNGTLAEGAPSVGMTEILTSQSIYSELALIQSLEGNIANLSANVSSLSSQVTELESVSTVYSIIFLNNIATPQSTSITSSSLASMIIDYTIVRGITSRAGTIKVTNLGGGATTEDDYVETSSTGVNISFENNNGVINLAYTTTNTGSNATFNYYIKSFI
jgi:hypothetical protein